MSLSDISSIVVASVTLLRIERESSVKFPVRLLNRLLIFTHRTLNFATHCFSLFVFTIKRQESNLKSE